MYQIFFMLPEYGWVLHSRNLDAIEAMNVSHDLTELDYEVRLDYDGELTRAAN
jgi:hypothetical protein